MSGPAVVEVGVIEWPGCVWGCGPLSGPAVCGDVGH